MRKQKNVKNQRTRQNSRKANKQKMEAKILPDTKFKTLFIKMLNQLRGRIDELTQR